ncbi:mucoidy inhibitor MuiA family protein [Bradyrhizobium diazoefficiens]|nr:mucoidy inhibitor MuiA family protein [Bradyrhizobium diazoefficiens]UCF52859.1 MAG: mucoidy inhibitor MuiA family protein [Bradyrhizobium sp.]MBR0964987.1 mucoidy inhibitor MuiA family protein [Bradyrhizobium diazoefficiens]MBR0976460.1 mucoidy inhibitor MuiA family protein [Bradyrhizobium diazoefficiens]MBR1008438.1 mucoidy inhibitor MuiA family protein [Bradyrhizobium diazoefficiens]MBR1014947.1 mucoidy inhibitor MuiA family protein [Bradyrhizobium diazoefficiens]
MRITARCLVTTSLVLVTMATALPSWAADVDATSAIDTVTVYPDGATVTRTIALDLASGDSTLVARDFPLSLDPSSLRVEGEAGAKLTIGTIDARPPRAAPPVNLPELDQRIEALKDQRADLQGTIDSANARRKFAQHFAEASPAGLGEKGEARPIAEWRAAFSAVAEEIATADAAIRDAARKQRELDRQLAQLEAERSAKPPSKLEVRIDVAAAAATKATLRVTYAVRSARWLPLYDARLDTGAKDRKPQLELVRRAEVTQSTGEDWTNVALGVSTARIGRGGSAPELGSLVAQYPQVPKPMALGAPSELARPATVTRQVQSPAMAKVADALERVDEQQAIAEIGDFQANFRIPGRVSLGAADGAKSLRIMSMSVPADLAVRAAPVLDPTAFLEASFKQPDDAALLPGKVAIYRDGIFVGRGKISASAKDDIVRLGFGADDKVRIERAVLKRNEGSAGLLVTTSKTDERSFKTTIRNGHDFPIRVAIEDQLPVSENEDIVVEMLPATTTPTASNIRDKRGVLEWSFDAKPGEIRDINFAWRVRWPKDKSITIAPAG